jgi:hypothetical protein
VYNEQQKRALALNLRKKFLDGEAEGYEIVVALLAMVKDKRLKEKDIKPILMTVHMNNPVGVMRSLQRAYEIVDDDMLNEIIQEIKARS